MFGPSIISVLTTLSLTFSVALAPDPAGTDAGANAGEAPPPELAQLSYAQALEALNEADNLTNMDAKEGAPQLFAALAAMQDFAQELAADPDNWQLRLYARVNLARAYLELEQKDDAAAAMDEAIREAMSIEVPAQDFGKRVERLYHERLEALEAEGQGTLDIQCGPACKVYINETEDPVQPTQLYPGIYRVWVVAPMGEREDLRKLVQITPAGASLEFLLPPEPPPPPPAEEALKRLLPQGAEIGLMFGGVALAALGAGMAGGGVASDLPGTIGVGAAFAVIGAGLLTTGIVTLTLDEKRRADERVDRTAMLNYTMKF